MLRFKKYEKIVFLVVVVVIIVALFILYNLYYTEKVVYDKDEIIIPVNVHLVDDGTVQYTTNRNVDDIDRIFNEVNRIWGQAQIVFVIAKIDAIKISNKEFSSVFSGDTEALTGRDDFSEGMINGYFARYINANGIAFPPQGFFVIGDITSVNDFRATSHELGHLLGLRHVSDINYLMYRGSNGELLSQEEVVVARSNARRVYEAEYGDVEGKK